MDDNAVRLACPNCERRWMEPREEEGGYRCAYCGWRGLTHFCNPLPDDNAPAETAGLEDAVCANHPGKKAVAVCAGTGDYICSLCRVTLNGRDFSVQYVDREGEAAATKLFASALPRPDRTVNLMFFLSWLLGPFAVVFFIVSTVYVRRAARLRRENALYRLACRWKGMWFAWSLNLLQALVWVGIVGYFGVAALMVSGIR